MKKIIFTKLMTITFFVVSAQKHNIVNASIALKNSNLIDAKDYIDQAYNNEKTSPPIPVDIGSTTFKTAAAAIAASTALPPFFNISKPALAAKGWLVAIDPFDPNTSERLELYLLNLKVLISYFDLGLNISVNASPSKFQQKIKIHTTATGARICSG